MSGRKLVKARLKKARDKTMAQVDLGSLYLRIGREAEAEKPFQSALLSSPTGRGPAKRSPMPLSNWTNSIWPWPHYEKAMPSAKDGYGYHYELANLQGLRGDYEGMVDSFMACSTSRPNYLRTVQNSFNRNLRVSTTPASGHGPAERF